MHLSENEVVVPQILGQSHGHGQGQGDSKQPDRTRFLVKWQGMYKCVLFELILYKLS